eukprot:scaffold2061_cov246-Pinguiococcus_pyrenoidosus.AAC.6
MAVLKVPWLASVVGNHRRRPLGRQVRHRREAREAEQSVPRRFGFVFVKVERDLLAWASKLIPPLGAQDPSFLRTLAREGQLEKPHHRVLCGTPGRRSLVALEKHPVRGVLLVRLHRPGVD